MDKNILYRSIPKVDVLLEDKKIISLIEKYHKRCGSGCYKGRNRKN